MLSAAHSTSTNRGSTESHHFDIMPKQLVHVLACVMRCVLPCLDCASVSSF